MFCSFFESPSISFRNDKIARGAFIARVVYRTFQYLIIASFSLHIELTGTRDQVKYFWIWKSRTFTEDAASQWADTWRVQSQFYESHPRNLLHWGTVRNFNYLSSFIGYKVQEYAATPEQLTLEEKDSQITECLKKTALNFRYPSQTKCCTFEAISTRLPRNWRNWADQAELFSQRGEGWYLIQWLIPNRRTSWLHHVVY